MNLTLIKDFFTCQANVQLTRLKKTSSFLSTYPNINLFSLFKQISFGSTPQLNAVHMKKYMSQFNSNLQIVNPNQINQLSTSKDLGTRTQLSDQQILQKGINLFLNYWANSIKQFSFTQFSKFMINQQSFPDKAQQVPYHAKKKLYQIFQTQIQGLLNIQTLRQVCIKQYKNLTDLFELLANKNTYQIDKSSVKNLYLMHSQRLDQAFFGRLQKRLRIPLSFQNFVKLLKKNQAELNQKTTQRKIYYSSARRKQTFDLQDYFQEDNISKTSKRQNKSNYQTPQTQKAGFGRQATSTKLTKGQKISQLKHAAVNVSKFKLTETPQKSRLSSMSPYQPKQIQILGQILSIEQSFIQLKRNLCLRKDFDLELVYERNGLKFEQILNKLYGLCNFTSFVRFIVPQDFEHKYLTFIRHETSNNISQQTQSLIDDLLQSYTRKQIQIESLWSKIDRQMIFRMYCNPCDQSINGQDLNKYFSERESNILLDRMDPLKTGYIQYQNFK